MDSHYIFLNLKHLDFAVQSIPWRIVIFFVVDKPSRRLAYRLIHSVPPQREVLGPWIRIFLIPAVPS